MEMASLAANMRSSSAEKDAVDLDENMSCGDFVRNIGKAIVAKTGADWGRTFLRIVVLITSIYFFLFSLDLMGTAFKVSQPHHHHHYHHAHLTTSTSPPSPHHHFTTTTASYFTTNAPTPPPCNTYHHRQLFVTILNATLPLCRYSVPARLAVCSIRSPTLSPAS
jgi:hypothetical protein